MVNARERPDGNSRRPRVRPGRTGDLGYAGPHPHDPSAPLHPERAHGSDPREAFVAHRAHGDHARPDRRDARPAERGRLAAPARRAHGGGSSRRRPRRARHGTTPRGGSPGRQGPRGCGRARDLERVAPLPRSRGGARLDPGRAPQGRRRDRRRQDECSRVRPHGDHQEPALRSDTVALGSGADARRFERRFRGGACRRGAAPGDRERWGWIRSGSPRASRARSA